MTAEVPFKPSLLRTGCAAEFLTLNFYEYGSTLKATLEPASLCDQDVTNRVQNPNPQVAATTAGGELTGTSVSGGQNNMAIGGASSVSGGRNRTALGNFDWAAGPFSADE